MGGSSGKATNGRVRYGVTQARMMSRLTIYPAQVRNTLRDTPLIVISEVDGRGMALFRLRPPLPFGTEEDKKHLLITSGGDGGCASPAPNGSDWGDSRNDGGGWGGSTGDR